MSPPLKILGGTLALVVLLVAGLYAYRSAMLYEGRTPEGYQLLSPVPDAKSFEPKALPATPILDNHAPRDLTVDFGYKVGSIAYSYSLALSFSGPQAGGRATVTAHHATREAAVTTDIVRRWDEPRGAYAVALQDRFAIDPAVPSLCIKAVIGPQTTSYDLHDASICVAQRDGTGACHPETLACGLIR